MTAWSSSPNAEYIDQLLDDLVNYSHAFDSSRQYIPAWAESWNEAVSAVGGSTRHSAWMTAMDSAWGATHYVAGDASRGAILALIAYDHAGQYMTMLPEQALVWGELRGDHAYILLRPYLRIRAEIARTQEIII